MAIAAFWGTTAGYTHYPGGAVVVESIDNRVIVISEKTFNYLYYKLDEFNAALKEDCIEYVVINPDHFLEDCVIDYPKWFLEAVDNGDIFTPSKNVIVLYGIDGDIVMRPNSMVLRNYRGELKHMESFKFHQYYDVPEGCL